MRLKNSMIIINHNLLFTLYNLNFKYHVSISTGFKYNLSVFKDSNTYKLKFFLKY